jgi:hypothetical protein
MDSWNRNPLLGKARIPLLPGGAGISFCISMRGIDAGIVIAASGKNRNVNRAAAIAGST